MRTVACSRPPSPAGATSGSPWIPAHSGHGVAVFDLDRTLIRGSSLSRYGRELVARGLVPKGLVARHAVAEMTFRRRGIGTARLERLVTSLLRAAAGRDAEPLTAAARDIGRALAADVSPAARFLVDRHLSAGDFCVVLSASPHVLVDSVSAALGVHRAVGTQIEVTDGTLTGRLDGPLCYGAAKRDALEREVGLIDLSTATAYADSASDLPLLLSCGTAVAVNPDRELRRWARHEAWPIVHLD